MKSRNLIAMLLCAVMAFSVCDVSGSTVQESQTRSQKQAKVEFPQGWDQGWFNNGAAQYCMTSCIGSDISCTINVYGDGLQFYFETLRQRSETLLSQLIVMNMARSLQV